MLHERITNIGAAEAGQNRASLDEVALVRRVAQGDGAAFETLYGCYYPRLTRFLGRVTRQPQLVEEILNDTMLVVWRKSHTYDLSSKVSTWIFAIAYRRTLKALKRADRVLEFDPEDDVSPVKSGPEGEFIQQELRAFLSRTMTALSAEHRAVIELTYYQGYAYQEIAEIMGCPIDTVKTRMFYARRRLKALLTDHEEVKV
ncbi:MAG: RNA polymerase sigma factor [Sulfuricaulis sp.]